MDFFRKIDKERRLKYYKNELNIIALKYLINNPVLLLNNNFINKFMLKDSFTNFLKKNSLNKIVNYCVLTGRSRGVLRKFKMSRLKFKELASKGWISGFIHSNW